MFEGFEEWDLQLGEVTIHGRSAGVGPAVILLHGHPRTHTTWNRVAPELVTAEFTVVCPDLRGYGQSSKPAPDANHETYCDRAMAADVVAVMHALGHRNFAVVGHDRGSYVAYRCALDHPRQVAALAVLDCVPLVEAPGAGRRPIRGDVAALVLLLLTPSRAGDQRRPVAWYQPNRQQMGPENYNDMVAAISNPATVRAMLEDYRASLHVDRRHDELDRAAGRTISCPTLVAWSTRDDMETLYGEPTEIWRPWCSGDLTSGTVQSGHHMAEENPEQLTTLLQHFLAAVLLRVPGSPISAEGSPCGAEWCAKPKP